MEPFTLVALITAFIAGVITIVAPCVLPILPVIIGGSSGEKNYKKPITIIASLSVSIIVFTLLLRVSTALIGVDPKIWTSFSGGILIVFGLLTLFPEIWEKVSTKLNLAGGSNKFLVKGMHKGGIAGDIMIGAALGPIFTACSPTFATIVSTTIPASYGVGLTYLVAFVIGLAIPLGALSIYGQKLTGKLSSLSDPHGVFKRAIALVFLFLGLSIIVGWDKDFEAFLISHGLYDWQVTLEQWLSDR